MKRAHIDRGISEPDHEIIPNKLGNIHKNLYNTNVTSGRTTSMSEVSKVENVEEDDDSSDGGERGAANGQGACGFGEGELEDHGAEPLSFSSLRLERGGTTEKKQASFRKTGETKE